MNIRRFFQISLILVTCLMAGVATAQTCGTEDVADATREVTEASQELRFALDVFSRSLRRDSHPLVSTTPSQTLSQAQLENTRLSQGMQRLATLLDEASAEQAAFAQEALKQAEIDQSRFADATQWIQSPSTGGVGAVDWCGGAADCLALKHGCGGCYKCYVDQTCGCFTPPDDIQGCQ